MSAGSSSQIAPYASNYDVYVSTNQAYTDVGGFHCRSAGASDDYTHSCNASNGYPNAQYGDSSLPDDIYSGSKAGYITSCSSGAAQPQPECYSLKSSASQCAINTVNGQSVTGVAYWQYPNASVPWNNLNTTNMTTGCHFTTSNLLAAGDERSGQVINNLISNYGSQAGNNPSNLVSAMSKSGGIIDTFCKTKTTKCQGGLSSCLMYNTSDSDAYSICEAYATSYPSQSDAAKISYCSQATNTSSSECSCILRANNDIYNSLKNAATGNAGCWFTACKDATSNSGILADSLISNVNCPDVCQVIQNFVATENSNITVNGDLINNVSCDFTTVAATQATQNAVNLIGSKFQEYATQQEYNQSNQSTWQQYKYYILIGCSFAFLLILILLLYWLGRRQDVAIDNIYQNIKENRTPTRRTQLEMITQSARSRSSGLSSLVR